MQQPISKKLFQYWNNVRGSRRAPRRFEIEPSHIADLLPETFIAECHSADLCTFRLAGSRIGHTFGQDLKGTDLLSLWSARDSEALRSLLHCVVEDAGIGVITFSASGSDGKSFTFEMTLLPLKHSDEKITRLLGNISTDAPPHRFGHSRLDSFRLKDVNLIWPDFSPDFMLKSDLVEEPPAISQGYSRIVRSDRRCFRVYDGGRKDLPQ